MWRTAPGVTDNQDRRREPRRASTDAPPPSESPPRDRPLPNPPGFTCDTPCIQRLVLLVTLLQGIADEVHPFRLHTPEHRDLSVTDDSYPDLRGSYAPPMSSG